MAKTIAARSEEGMKKATKTTTKSTATKTTTKAAATKTATAKTAATKATAVPKAISSHQRWQMVSEQAYYLAQKRNFFPGGEENDWLQAEAIVDKLIKTGKI